MSDMRKETTLKKGCTAYIGGWESTALPTMVQLLEEEQQAILVTSNTERAKKLAEDLCFFLSKPAEYLPGEEAQIFQYDARDNKEMLARLKVLKDFVSEKPMVLVCPASIFVRKMAPPALFKSNIINIKVGDERPLEQLKEQLVTMGYEMVNTIECPGQMASRGGILDVYSPEMVNPVRLEFFGDEIDSIRIFDEESQRSLENIQYTQIIPAEELISDESIFNKAAKNISLAYDKAINQLQNQLQTEGSTAKKDQDLTDEQIKLINLQERKGQILDYVNTRRNIQLLDNYMDYFFENTSFIWAYGNVKTLVIEDPARIVEHLTLREEEMRRDFNILLDMGKTIEEESGQITGMTELQQAVEALHTSLICPFQSSLPFNITKTFDITTKQTEVFNGRMQDLSKELRAALKDGFKITLVPDSPEKADNLKDFLGREELAKVQVKVGKLSSGYKDYTLMQWFISDSDIFGQQIKSRKRHSKKAVGQRITSFAQMKSGDLVVCEEYGIGRFLNISSMEVDGETKDYIQVQYAGSDMLYVPVEQMDMVQKYIGGEDNPPKIHKLSSNEWKNTKAKAQASIEEMAKKLVEIYAKRKVAKGYSFSKDTVWQREFEDQFPYTETDDQLRCIDEIKGDMESPQPMDRLLCGDVGFGKTEVAARAVFKCLAEGKQAAVLVPTTILANQHYNTLKERVEAFPFKAEMLSRFRSPKEQEEIIEKLENGSLDLIVGTHRLLSKDVKYKDLGLLVIDEEQRFGVMHKEKIKELKAGIDVLTLSATPIPRTLNMSLTGIKDMSVIDEPPLERYPVQTYVLEEEDYILRQVINRELDRGGQVFIVYNRVKGIYKLAERIKQLVPDGRIGVGHGQMNEHALEDVMVNFIEGKTNILIATTIIESGIDISNANTMIVLDADKYGLAQLYQLRGRVGRSKKMGYAYLMYQKNKVLTEVAQKRLMAIKEFTEFGSGFKVAMRDLELRGAGSLLGSQQSGHIMNIGYELYCKMVDKAVRQAKGLDVEEKNLAFTFNVRAEAIIPSWYIESETLKLEIYKKIAEINNPQQMDELYDEILDRFGDLPKGTENLLKISLIRALASKAFLESIDENNQFIIFKFEDDKVPTAETISKAMALFPGRTAFSCSGKPFIRLTKNKGKKLDEIMELLKIIVE